MPKVAEFKWVHQGRLVSHQWHVHCPGCGHIHALGVGIHGFNGDFEKPTFTPYLLVTYDRIAPEIEALLEQGKPLPPVGEDGKLPGTKSVVCHSFVRDGMFQFLSDSTHALAGQTVPVPDFTPDRGMQEGDHYVKRT